MSKYIHKSHNVTVLIYHLVFPAKYRRAVLTKQVEKKLRAMCIALAARCEVQFLEIAVGKDHVHMLLQSVPRYSVRKIVTMIKSITAREIFKQFR